ncbi:UPF0158 family protein [Actinomadura livida]|uniref:HTH OST-type domain-containing protein n=1 Tax=Actinomadura livida TaxID=79909 RepID=A0A7W7N2B6_9ACTN|nr:MULTISPECIES: UPF0158 family protein [Actinomadura]MBB4778822.1 hypothetical protein [Actinomadura catellatispora]GGU38624.1 hypothetical protein GCM10010208_73830 [Actinomadura livida]
MVIRIGIGDVLTSEAAGQKTEAFQALVSAVTSLSSTEGAPTASEVRLELRRITYNGFNLNALGYRRFRDFLTEAEQYGYINIDRARPGDYSLSLAGEPLPDAEPVREIRSDLWRAFIDWTPGKLRFYDIVEDKAIVIPETPAPLEPERFRDARERIGLEPSKFIPISHITLSTQLDWMRQFSIECNDARLRDIFDSALAGDKPAKLFHAVLREVPEQRLRWRRILLQRVRAEVEKWREGNDEIKGLRIDRTPTHADNPTERTVGEISSQSEKGFVHLVSQLAAGSKVKGSAGGKGPISSPSDVETLRSMLHGAIDRMPIEELKAIRLPIGYLLQD